MLCLPHEMSYTSYRTLYYSSFSRNHVLTLSEALLFSERIWTCDVKSKWSAQPCVGLSETQGQSAKDR